MTRACPCGVCFADKAARFIFRLIVAFAIGYLFALATAASVSAVEKTDICHLPPGNPENVQYISIGDPAYEAHLAHGDTACTDLNEPVDDCTPTACESETPLPPPNGCKDQCEGIGDPSVVVAPNQRPLSPVAYPDGAGQPPLLPDTAMSTEDTGDLLIWLLLLTATNVASYNVGKLNGR